MPDRLALNSPWSRIFLYFAAAAGLAMTAYLALLRPGYFSNSDYLGALIVFEVLLATVWNYQKAFLPVLMVVFFWAGMRLPLEGVWTSGRWLVLALGALVGVVVYMRDRQPRFTSFHLVALLCVLAALVSAFASAYPSLTLLKVVSLLLLFLYGAFGARAAVRGRESSFISGFLVACEVLVAVTAFAYFILRDEIFSNPNSLGAVVGVVAVPALLWGIRVSERPTVRYRRILFLGISLLLLFRSYARAGIMAAAVSCVLLCVGLRLYRLLIKVCLAGIALAAIAAALMPLRSAPSGSLASTYLYKGHREEGILGSRKSVWDQAFSAIRERPWFGSGFGTSTTADDDSARPLGSFESAPQATREHGNSYLAIVEWDGLLGSAPFFVLLILVLQNIVRVFLVMRRTGDPSPPAVLLATVMFAALVNTAFEDWLFAPGYYLCVLFWALAFIAMDFRPAPVPAVAAARNPHSHHWPVRLGLAAPLR